MKIKTVSFLFICSFILIIGCTKNSVESPDFIDGQLLHPIQCRVINFDCDESLGAGNSIQCRGIATHGNRCGSNTLNACGYCVHHIAQAPPPGQCLHQTTNASGICDYHKEFVALEE
jgi:hypothetical protein